MQNSDDDILREDINKTPNHATSNHPEAGIKVSVRVSVEDIDDFEPIEVTFAPDAGTLLSQAENLFIQIFVCARGLMLQILARRFLEAGISGVFPEDVCDCFRARAIISTPRGIVAVLDGVDVASIPEDVARTKVFENEKAKDAQNKLIVALLAELAARGGQ